MTSQTPEANEAIAAAAAKFRTLPLEDLGCAELMDRMDRKFLVPAALMPGILEDLSDRYRVLEVCGRRLSRYSTRYFDTPDLAMYHAHHSGRTRRYKVRVRRYVDSEVGYLEVKLKGHQGRTVKARVPLDGRSPMERLAEERILGVTDQMPAAGLHEAMVVEYTRLTLVRNDLAERITLDLMLTFSHGDKRRAFPGVVVAEVKQSGRGASPFVDAMRALNLREGSLSKYCAGIATLEPAAKSNRFRPALRRLYAVGDAA